MRPKLPSLPDYDPLRQRTRAEATAKAKLFPDHVTIGERVERLESVTFDVVQEQIRVAPHVETSRAYVEDETNARSSAMAHAERMTELLADIKRTQRKREKRNDLMYWALAAPIVVILAGLWAHTDAATLATAAAAIAGVSVAIVHTMAGRNARVRESDSIRPAAHHDDKGGFP